MITLSSENTSDHLVAGRRAAHVQLIFDGRQAGCNYTGATPEQYDGKDALKVAGFDIGPTIDAAILETVARCHAPHVIIGVPPRSRWRLFWTAYRGTMLAGAPWLFALGLCVLCYNLANWIHGT